MNRLAKLAALLLLMPILAAPFAACVTKAATAEEQQCCREMGGQCGEDGTSSHPCCKHLPAPVQLDAAKSPFKLDHYAVTVGLPAPAASLELPNPTVFAQFFDLADSPPGSPPSLSSVLRI